MPHRHPPTEITEIRTTASRSCVGRPGGSSRSAAICSSAGWPAGRRCWRPATRCSASRPQRDAAKRVAASSAVVSLGLLVHDLGKPSRFLNMMRVFKPTSPMSVGSWVLAGYVPAAIASNLPGAGMWRRVSIPATCVAAALGPVVASYTAVLIGDTAIPAWHDAADQLPTAFVSSAAMAAGGASLALAPVSQLTPARRFGVVGAVVELVALERMRRRLGIAADAYRRPGPHRLMRAGQVLAIAGAVGTVVGRRSTLGHPWSAFRSWSRRS